MPPAASLLPVLPFRVGFIIGISDEEQAFLLGPLAPEVPAVAVPVGTGCAWSWSQSAALSVSSRAARHEMVKYAQPGATCQLRLASRELRGASGCYPREMSLSEQDQVLYTTDRVPVAMATKAACHERVSFSRGSFAAGEVVQCKAQRT